MQHAVFRYIATLGLRCLILSHSVSFQIGYDVCTVVRNPFNDAKYVICYVASYGIITENVK
jgi:hypothetical protein